VRNPTGIDLVFEQRAAWLPAARTPVTQRSSYSCGIAGEIARGRPANLAAIEAMTLAMESRGPDSSGVWAREGVALGHRRLSIIDLSNHGHQPMHDAELGLTVAFNGCIYNYPELPPPADGKVYRFFSHSVPR